MNGPTTRVRLRVSPRARGAKIVGRHGDAWKVRVASAPERGRANDEVISLLAGALHVSATDLELVQGTAARDKVVAVAGLSEDEVDARLGAAAGGS